jgi:proteasome lid subunit RPN8/RPN11
MRRRIELDAALDPVVLPALVLNEVFAHAREAEPEECCGLVTGDDLQTYRHVVRCRNDLTRHHQRDPASYPRDGREGFHMNEQDYLDASEQALARGERVTCIYHSHVGCGAWFSELDQEYAGQPAFPFPDADHLVVSVIGGKVVEQVLFRREPPSAGDRDPARSAVRERPEGFGTAPLAFVGRAVVFGPC